MKSLKICINCKIEKPITDFYKHPQTSDGLLGRCKTCQKENSAKSQNKNKEHRRQYLHNYNKENRASIRKNHTEYMRERQAIDPLFKLAVKLRRRLNMAVKNGKKSASAVKDLGCTLEELRSYLEAKFQPGMTWGNYGDWHIDHIVPLKKFNLSNPIELKQAIHFSNLQPLWAIDNLRKQAF